jgi:hypothetical protein
MLRFAQLPLLPAIEHCWHAAIGLYKHRQMNHRDFSHELDRLMDPYWRKARIGARLLIKHRAGKAWTSRDRRLAQRLVDDPGVTNRLLDQAVHSLEARRQNGPGILGWFH